MNSSRRSQVHQADGGLHLAHPPGRTQPDVAAPEEAGLALVAVDAGLVADGSFRVRIMPPSAPATTLVG